ncbi:MAG: NADH-quinone oxidoreductase subunit J [Deltaproteobacteria bacterium]|nr:NADH-quinone oxidoreductase subunit J [Deltaproteobacteria bacterium]
MPLWLFVFLAVLAVLSALGVILQRNPVHCLLALAINLLAAGVIFIGLGATTVGFLQIIIYVGAIMVLFLFVIWLLNLQAEGLSGYFAMKFWGAIGAAALAAELAAMFLRTPQISRVVTLPQNQGSITTLGRSLFSDYLIAFEITSVLLLAAVVGAIGLARRLPVSIDQAETGRQPGSRGPSRTAERREQLPTSIPAPAQPGTGSPERRSA